MDRLTTTLRTGFVRNAERLGDALALTLEGRDYTYAEVDQTARRWAGALIDTVGHRPARVAILASRSETSYIGTLAVLLAGAAFVPLNRRFPTSRTLEMLRQADVDAILSDDGSLAQLADLLDDLDPVPVVLLPESPHLRAAALPARTLLAREALARRAPLMDLPEVRPDDLAYLLFTSGSTGAPKGVPITHANVRAFLDVNRRRYALSSDDRLSQTFDQTFDLSVFDLFTAWDSGACVCAMSAIELLAPVRTVAQHGLTVWFSVPSVASMALRRGALKPGSMPTLRWSLFCGEGLPRATAEAWQAAAPSSVVDNLYGPTELTIACAVHRFQPGESCPYDLVPIGETYPGLTSIVIDDALCDVPAGERGELCVAGAQTTPGYWRAPHLDQERFFVRRGPGGTTQRFYRTGDIVERRDAGYVYVGRNDHQVKVGGHRVELAEIEAVLRSAGCLEAVALLACEGDRTGITAVVTGDVDLAAVQRAAATRLPWYMAPQSVRVVDELPLNANGKIDRKAVGQWLHTHLRVA